MIEVKQELIPTITDKAIESMKRKIATTEKETSSSKRPRQSENLLSSSSTQSKSKLIVRSTKTTNLNRKTRRLYSSQWQVKLLIISGSCIQPEMVCINRR